MESTGQIGRIQLTQSSADLLITAGKERWIRAREDKVEAKGKGTMQTYWLEIDSPKGNDDAKDLADRDKQLVVVEDPAAACALNRSNGVSRKHARLAAWMAEVLLDYVKQIVSAMGRTNRSQDYPEYSRVGLLILLVHR